MPTPLYHYTSLAGLHGILSSQSLQLTDVAFQNDRTQLPNAVALLDSLPPAKVPGLYRDTLENLMGAGSDRSFVMSFSTLGDDLGQWRGYGDQGSGFALGFSEPHLRKLSAHVSEDAPPRLWSSIPYLSLTECNYVTDPAETVASFIRERVGGAEERILESGYQGTTTQAGVHMMLGEAAMLASLSKHVFFQSEQEWRLVIAQGKIDKQEASARSSSATRVRPGTLTPYRSVHLTEDRTSNSPLNGVLEEIVLGPAHYGREDLVAHAVETLLYEHDWRDVDVRPSAGPFSR